MGPKTGPRKKWFLHVPVDGDPFKIGVPWSTTQQLSEYRFSLIYVGFDEHPKSRVIATQDFSSPSTVSTLSPAGQQQMSSMWHHGISWEMPLSSITPLNVAECSGFCFFRILFEYPFGMIHFLLLHFDMSSMSSMSSEHLRPFSGRNWWRFSWCRLRLISNRESCWL